MYDIVGKKRWYFLFSAILTVPGLVFILLGGLKPSVDFTGGTVWQVRYASNPSPAAVRATLVSLGHPEATVRSLPDSYLEIRTAPVDLLPSRVPSPLPSAGAVAPAASSSVKPTATTRPTPTPRPSPIGSPAPSPAPGAVSQGTPFAELEKALENRYGAAAGGKPRSVTTVGPIIGTELVRSSAILIIIGELFILAYLWIRFGFRYGTAAIVALLHDVVVVVGIFAILGFFFGVEFDALFVTALLTVIGFSVHDTIVVFDRIRENRVRHAGEPFGAIVNHSILQTLGRSIGTSLTVIVTLTALLLLGPASIKTFTLALLIGVVSGTYSSIFNASQILVAWYEWEARRRSGRASGTRAVRPLPR
ncbi:MAG: protein translocase subunit SecF [Chloroflexota bacterium]|nr:protein translocase subunit SecF [Chloroflexota bacterium]